MLIAIRLSAMPRILIFNSQFSMNVQFPISKQLQIFENYLIEN